jgi:hypothetical protein
VLPTEYNLMELPAYPNIVVSLAFTLIAPRHRLEIASLVITAKEFCDLYPFTPGTTFLASVALVLEWSGMSGVHSPKGISINCPL